MGVFTLNAVLKAADPPQQQLAVGAALVGGDVKIHQAVRQTRHLTNQQTGKIKQQEWITELLKVRVTIRGASHQTP